MTNVIHLAGHSAAPHQPATGRPRDPIQLHAEAQNALSMALHYMRQPGAANVPGASRKAVQALSALRMLGSAGVCTSAQERGA